MRAAYPEKHTKKGSPQFCGGPFLHAPGERCRPDGPRRPARFTLPRMNALARLRPGSSCGLPASAARQRKGTKRIITPAAQGPPGPAPSISRAMRRFLLPHARVQTQKPRLPRVSCSRARWTSVGGNEKLRIPDAKPSGSYSAYGWVERSPRRIPRPWPAPPSGGLRGGGNSFQRFSSSVQPKSL